MEKEENERVVEPIVKKARIEDGKEGTKEGEKKEKFKKDDRKRLFWRYFGEKATMGYCLCCGQPFSIVDQFHLGHIIAKSLGGADSLSNRVPLCSSCNNNGDNTQNQLDYMFKMKHGTHWLERLLKTVATCKLFYVEEEKHKPTFFAEKVEGLHSFALYLFGNGVQGGIKEEEIFGLLQKHEDLYFNVLNAQKRFDCVFQVVQNIQKSLEGVLLEKEDAKQQLDIANKKYKQFVE